MPKLTYAQNPLDTFPHNFPVNGRVVNLLATSRCNGIWETDMTQIARANFLQTCRLCCRIVAHLLRENWCNGFRPLSNLSYWLSLVLRRLLLESRIVIFCLCFDFSHTLCKEIPSNRHPFWYWLHLIFTYYNHKNIFSAALRAV